MTIEKKTNQEELILRKMVKIGLILTTDGKIWNGRKKLEKFFRGRFQSADDTIEYQLIFAKYEDLPDPSMFSEYAGFVFSGSYHSVNDGFKWIQNLEKFVLQIDEYNQIIENKPVNLFGICFGHQLIAKAFGGAVRPVKQGFIFCCEEIEVTNQLCNKPWYRETLGHAKSFKISQIHSEEVVEIPSNATKVGHSKSCRNEAFFYGDHIFSLQGHPEDRQTELRVIKGGYMVKHMGMSHMELENILNHAHALDSDILMKMCVSFLTHNQ